MLSPKTLTLVAECVGTSTYRVHATIGATSILLLPKHTLLAISFFSLARSRGCKHSHRSERTRTHSHTGAAVRLLPEEWLTQFFC